MINKKTFVLQNELPKDIDKLLNYFSGFNFNNKIDNSTVKELEKSIDSCDIFVKSDLRWLISFMALNHIDMIYLGSK